MGGIKGNIEQILREISSVFSDLEERQVGVLADEILKANKIVACGAGRVGMAARGFGMRLGHLGLPAYSVGDSTAPRLKEGDLFIVGSGSGETQTIYDLAQIAKENGAKFALITGNLESRMAKIADAVVLLKAP